ncbi:MAG: YetF domain-containing protein [Candidatus Limnocylindrales bacterium]
MPDFGAIFLPDTPLLEIFIRGSLTYLVLFLLLRLTFNRSSSSIGVTDLLVIVLIADAAQNAMAAGYQSWTDGMLLVGTIIGWAYAMDWLAYRYPSTIGRFVHPKPRELVRDGRKNQRNLDRELISEDELMTQLRLEGVDDIADVELASMEGNGEISVIKREPGKRAPVTPEGSDEG